MRKHIYFIGLFLVIILTGIFLPQLKQTNTPESYIPSDAPTNILAKEVKEQFNNEEILLFLVKNPNLLEHKFLKKLFQLTEEIQSLNGVADVVSGFSMDHISPSPDGFRVSPLFDLEEISTLSVDQIKKRIASDSIAYGKILSKDFDSTAIIIEPELGSDSPARLKLRKEITDLFTKFDLQESLVGMSGDVAIGTTEFEEQLENLKKFIPITTLVAILLIRILFGSWLKVLITMVSVTAVIQSTIILFVIFDLYYTMVGTIIPTLLMSLTIAFLIHFYNALNQSHEGDIEKRINSARKKVLRPTLYTALTTTVGLLSLTSSEIVPVKTFGLISGFGVIITFLITMFVVPEIYKNFPDLVWRTRGTSANIIDRLIETAARLSTQYPKRIVLLFFIVCASLAPFILQVKVESNLLRFFPEDHYINVSNKLVEEELIGTTPVVLVIDGESDQHKLSSSMIMQFMDKLDNHFVSDKAIDDVAGAHDILKQLNWAFNSGQAQFKTVPESDKLIDQYLFVYDGEDLSDFLSDDRQRSRSLISLNIHSANEIDSKINQIDQWIKDNIPAGYTHRFTGMGKLLAEQENLLVEGQIKSLFWSVGLIFLIMIFMWKNIGSSAICMIPNISPVFIMFSLMGIFNIWLDFGTAMISSVAVGIAVDDTIHLYYRIMKLRKEGEPVALAIRNALNQSGKALVMTTFILSFQFFCLGLSSYAPAKFFGILTGVGLIAALVFDLLLLPSLVMLSHQMKRKAINS